MTTRRRQFREMEVLEVLLMQGIKIRCFRCGEPITFEQLRAGKIEKEHLHELELGGADMPENCRYSHKDCHAVITNGTPATSAGSSKHRIAKATNPKRIEKFVVNKLPVDEALQKHAEQSAASHVLFKQPTPRCHRCGEYIGDCTCPPQKKSCGFGRKAVHA